MIIAWRVVPKLLTNLLPLNECEKEVQQAFRSLPLRLLSRRSELWTGWMSCSLDSDIQDDKVYRLSHCNYGILRHSRTDATRSVVYKDHYNKLVTFFGLDAVRVVETNEGIKLSPIYDKAYARDCLYWGITQYCFLEWPNLDTEKLAI